MHQISELSFKKAEKSRALFLGFWIWIHGEECFSRYDGSRPFVFRNLAQPIPTIFELAALVGKEALLGSTIVHQVIHRIRICLDSSGCTKQVVSHG